MKKAAVIGLGDISPIHLAAIAGIDQELYEAAKVDAAWQDIFGSAANQLVVK